MDKLGEHPPSFIACHSTQAKTFVSGMRLPLRSFSSTVCLHGITIPESDCYIA